MLAKPEHRPVVSIPELRHGTGANFEPLLLACFPLTCTKVRNVGLHTS